MKQGIHPQYYLDATTRCACGEVFTIPATIQSMDVEICSHCHPFYTGAKRMVDSAGRVERFKARLQKTEQLKKTKKGKK